MIIESGTVETQANGFMSSKTAEIKATPQMLRMLSSGIYADKISAFIRELSTNAFDAMVEAGTIQDKTFMVHLPTSLEPWFMIRDFGTGLSQEGMENNFSNFGDGTKAESNVYNGTFGLGSKSPLSYVRNFTIISYYNGIKTFYNYGKDADDIPTLSTAFSEESDEPSGLEIQIAIKHSDISEVIRKAELIYRYFDKRPETNVPLEYHELPHVISGDNWFITTKDRHKTHYGYSEVNTPTRVIMGNVIYPISNTGFPSDSIITKLSQIPLVIKAEIGDVQITPSRESLEMTPNTIKYLEDFYKKVMSEISKGVEKKIDKKLPLYEKMIKAYEVLNLMPNALSECKVEDRIVKRDYRGILVKEEFKELTNIATFTRESSDKNYDHRKRTQLTFNWWYMPPSLNYIFLVVDSNKNVGSVIDDLKDKYTHVFIIRNAKKNSLFLKYIKEFIEKIGNPKYVLASDYVKTLNIQPKTKVSGTKVKSAPKTVVRFVTRSNYASLGYDVELKSDDTDTYYYIPTFNGDLTNPNRVASYRVYYYCHYLATLLENRLGKQIKLVGINPAQIPRVKKDSRFINFYEALEECNISIKVYKNHKELIKVINNSGFSDNVKRALRASSNTDLAILSKVNSMDTLLCYEDDVKMLGIKIIEKLEYPVQQIKDAIDKYALLRVFSTASNMDIPIFIINAVVAAIDKQKETENEEQKV